jgi:hypothetical protein
MHLGAAHSITWTFLSEELLYIILNAVPRCTKVNTDDIHARPLWKTIHAPGLQWTVASNKQGKTLQKTQTINQNKTSVEKRGKLRGWWSPSSSMHDMAAPAAATTAWKGPCDSSSSANEKTVFLSKAALEWEGAAFSWHAPHSAVR